MSSTDDEVDRSLRRGAGISEQERCNVGERFGMKRLDTLKYFMTLVKESHAVALF